MFPFLRLSSATRTLPFVIKASYSSTRSLFEKFSVVVPPMGESIKAGTLVQWEKKLGDFVEVDDIVAVVETDKVSMDIRCDKAGYLVKYLANPDDNVKVGAPIAEMNTNKEWACFSKQTRLNIR